MWRIFRAAFDWLFVPQERVRKFGTFDVPRIIHPLWWVMYHTAGRIEHRTGMQNSDRS